MVTGSGEVNLGNDETSLVLRPWWDRTIHTLWISYLSMNTPLGFDWFRLAVHYLSLFESTSFGDLVSCLVYDWWGVRVLDVSTLSYFLDNLHQSQQSSSITSSSGSSSRSSEHLPYLKCKVGFGQLSTQKTHDTNKEHIMQHDGKFL